MGISVSVVIPSYNRRERLARVLEGLADQSCGPERFEVVVVDDGSTDGTGGWLRERRCRFDLSVFEQTNRGPAAARNEGVARANGELVLFLDDDVVPGRDLVLEHLKMHDAEVDVVVMGPMSSLPSYRQPWVAWEQAKLEAQYRAMIRGDYAPTFRQFWTGNASLAKAHFVGAGGFDVSLPRGEDVELGQRLAARGLAFRFNPAAIGLHHAERSLESWSAMHRSYGKLEVEIFRRLGQGEAGRILSDNFRRLHPLNRWLLRGCLGRKPLYSMTTSTLSAWLRLIDFVGQPALSNEVCGALANLLYWDASAGVLGDAERRKVFWPEERSEMRSTP
ncbi:MAG TPA: glycosyltransferase family 2 protein [Polyangiaceae bacterium]|nr:glycosyltransferase family 2 protein [Polyangiaceae bacterium]